jgi:hypothetical protein
MDLPRITRGILAVHVIPLDAHRLLDQEHIVLGESPCVRPQSNIVIIQQPLAAACRAPDALNRTFPHYLTLHGFPHAVDANLTWVGAGGGRRVEWEDNGFVIADSTRFARLC